MNLFRPTLKIQNLTDIFRQAKLDIWIKIRVFIFFKVMYIDKAVTQMDTHIELHSCDDVRRK